MTRKEEKEARKLAKVNSMILKLMDSLSLANEKHARDSNVIDLQNKVIVNIEKERDEQRDTICKLQKEVEKYKKKYRELKEEKTLRKVR